MVSPDFDIDDSKLSPLSATSRRFRTIASVSLVLKHSKYHPCDLPPCQEYGLLLCLFSSSLNVIFGERHKNRCPIISSDCFSLCTHPYFQYLPPSRKLCTHCHVMIMLLTLFASRWRGRCWAGINKPLLSRKRHIVR